MENLFILLTLISLVCFLLSWIMPNTFSSLFKNKISKGKIRLIFGLSMIAFFVAFGITSDNNDSKTKNEEPAFSQKNTESTNSQEPITENKVEEIKENEISKFEEKDFSIYDEFFNEKNVQLKRIDRLVSNLSTSRHQTIMKIGNPADSEEWSALLDVQNKLYAVEEKLNKENSLHKIMIEAIDFYYDSADSCKDWLILLPPSLEFSDWNNFELVDNSLVEKMSKDCGMEERKNGDKKATELLNLLKQKGYKSKTDSEAIQAKQTTQINQEKSYKEVFSFSGEGAKNSEPFIITGNKFRVKYNCVKKTTTPLCQAVLRSPTDEILYKEIFNTIGETQSETVFYEKGTFYIEATVIGGEFNLTIEDYK